MKGRGSGSSGQHQPIASGCTSGCTHLGQNIKVERAPAIRRDKRVNVVRKLRGDRCVEGSPLFARVAGSRGSGGGGGWASQQWERVGGGGAEGDGSLTPCEPLVAISWWRVRSPRPLLGGKFPIGRKGDALPDLFAVGEVVRSGPAITDTKVDVLSRSERLDNILVHPAEVVVIGVRSERTHIRAREGRIGAGKGREYLSDREPGIDAHVIETLRSRRGRKASEWVPGEWISRVSGSYRW